MINRELGSKRLRSLSPEDVEAAFLRLVGGPSQLGRPSLIKIRSVLGKMLDYAQRRAIVNRNIARVVELPGDQAILLGVSCECGSLGLYSAAYGAAPRRRTAQFSIALQRVSETTSADGSL